MESDKPMIRIQRVPKDVYYYGRLNSVPVQEAFTFY